MPIADLLTSSTLPSTWVHKTLIPSPEHVPATATPGEKHIIKTSIIEPNKPLKDRVTSHSSLNTLAKTKSEHAPIGAIPFSIFPTGTPYASSPTERAALANLRQAELPDQGIRVRAPNFFPPNE